MAVIMAGYPATDVQEAFDLMQEIQGRDLRNFPGMPSNLPEAYFDFLDRLLNVNANRRESTASLMKHDFTRTAHDFGTSEDSQQVRAGEWIQARCSQLTNNNNSATRFARDTRRSCCRHTGPTAK